MTIQRVNSVWFPEPEIKDNTYAERSESTWDWLRRATVQRAKESRRFLNENLSKLPDEIAQNVHLTLQSRWDSAFFELIVGRMLQEMGATITYERRNPDGRKPDYVAQFSDGTFVVEAVSPVFNEEIQTTERDRNPLLEIVEKAIPDGWAVAASELPNIGPNDSKREFTRIVKELLRLSPPSEESEHSEVTHEFRSGALHLHLWPRTVGSSASRERRLVWEPDLSFMDNSVNRISYVIGHKRRQVRGSAVPVLLAIQAEWGTDSAHFDVALFGHTYTRFDRRYGEVSTGFNPDGEFNAKRVGHPTYAGVVAMFRRGFREWPLPVLYRHPRFAGELPGTILDLPQHFYDGERNEIIEVPGRAGNPLQALNFVLDSI